MDIGSQYPDAEDLIEAFDREFATLKESLNNIEQLFKRTLAGQTYLDESEVAQLLHCKSTEIPAVLPYYRGSRTGRLFKKSEIESYLESKRVPKRQN